MGKRKTVVCLETGKQFNSVENAANAIGVSSGFISRQIKAGKPIKGFYYYYAGEMLPDEYRQKIRNQKKKPNKNSRPGYDGGHEDISDGDSYELGEYENSEEALAAAEAFISTHGNEVNDEEDGIGSVIYWTVEVERRVEYKENEWLPCDESGRIDDGYGNEPNATVAYLSSLEGSREERAFELAKNEYLAWLEHKADRYTTVYGYMD